MPKPRSAVLLALVLGLAGRPAAWAATEEPPPARVEVAVSPDHVPPGGTAQVTVRIVPRAGVKINRYPKIKLVVPAQADVALPAETALGNDSAPPEGKMETNYFHSVDPLQLALHLAPGVSAGSHRVPAKLSYFYCVAASGYCAPARVPLEIPITVR